MIGRLSKNEDAPIRLINLPMLSPEGEPLCPTLRPLDWVLKKRGKVGEYDWESLFQGNPRPRGAKVFRDVQFYDELPVGPYRVAFGIDCAFAEKSRADFSVGLALAAYDRRDPNTRRLIDTLYYVLLVHHVQVESPAFAQILKGMCVAWPGAPMRWYCYGPEIGTAQHLRDLGITTLQAISMSADKFVRAQPAAAAWNAGKILVPKGAPWLAEFIREILGFTGVKDRHDDQVDALAAAYDLLAAGCAFQVGGTVTGERKIRSLGGF